MELKPKIEILTFEPLLKETIWGGQKLNFLKNSQSKQNIGESWELSAVDGSQSVVDSGKDKGLTLTQLIEKYKHLLVGKKCFKEFSTQFPLLLKFIDAEQDLSIQVHPNDAIAQSLENKFGKTEMWYIVEAQSGAEIIAGFDGKVDLKTYTKAFENNNITSILKHHKIEAGDAFFIPSGMVHAIKKGTFIAEIQQTSDVTYRIWDYNRTDQNGKTRELHTQKALKSIDFDSSFGSKITYTTKQNEASELVNCKYFTTNIIKLNSTIIRDYTRLDSFVVYMCVKGSVSILDNHNNTCNIKFGQTAMLSAQTGVLKLSPNSKDTVLLEIHL